MQRTKCSQKLASKASEDSEWRRLIGAKCRVVVQDDLKEKAKVEEVNETGDKTAEAAEEKTEGEDGEDKKGERYLWAGSTNDLLQGLLVSSLRVYLVGARLA